MSQQIFALVIVILGIIGAGVSASDLPRRGVLFGIRAFSFFICAGLAITYAATLLGILDSVTLPPIARPLVAALLGMFVGLLVFLRGR